MNLTTHPSRNHQGGIEGILDFYEVKMWEIVAVDPITQRNSITYTQSPRVFFFRMLRG